MRGHTGLITVASPQFYETVYAKGAISTKEGEKHTPRLESPDFGV